MAGDAWLSGDLRLAGSLDERFFRLLAAVEDSGSINQAAKAAGYSYKGAWLALEAAQNLSDRPLLHTRTGGSRGGGTQLTDSARRLLQLWLSAQQRHDQWLSQLRQELEASASTIGLFRRLQMKTTARNQFLGTVHRIDAAGPLALVTVQLPGGARILAWQASTPSFSTPLAVGERVIALVKSSSVLLSTELAGHALMADNCFEGSVGHVDKGAVNALVTVAVDGDIFLSASVTNDAVDALSLGTGQRVQLAFQASAVVLAREGAGR